MQGELFDMAGEESQDGVLRLYFDGACVVNPGGPGAWAFHVLDHQDKHLIEASGVLDEDPSLTNNVAEWEALVRGMRWLVEDGPTTVDKLIVYGDSQMVINQARGVWKCKKPHLQKYLVNLTELVGKMDVGNISFRWIPREQNQHADDLGNQALGGIDTINYLRH